MESVEISETNKLIEYIKVKQPRIIGIDGFKRVGKTYLTKKISKISKVKYINFDEEEKLLKKPFLNYVDEINYIELENIIIKFLDNGYLIIIDSICLLAIFERIKFELDLLIYVKKYWCDWLEKIESEKNIDDIIKDEFQEIENLKKCKAFGDNTTALKFDLKEHLLEKELLLYHREFKPYKKSKIIFNNNQNLF